MLSRLWDVSFLYTRLASDIGVILWQSRTETGIEASKGFKEVRSAFLDAFKAVVADVAMSVLVGCRPVSEPSFMLKRIWSLKCSNMLVQDYLPSPRRKLMSR
jgi:hypothetical protein